MDMQDGRETASITQSNRILRGMVTARARQGTPPPRSTREAKRARQRAMRELVARSPVSSQHEFVDLLRERGFDVTQATVSRDIAELGLVKVVRADRHVYASPEDLASRAATTTRSSGACSGTCPSRCGARGSSC